MSWPRTLCHGSFVQNFFFSPVSVIMVPMAIVSGVCRGRWQRMQNSSFGTVVSGFPGGIFGSLLLIFAASAEEEEVSAERWSACCCCCVRSSFSARWD